jgi:hypothetical protein
MLQSTLLDGPRASSVVRTNQLAVAPTRGTRGVISIRALDDHSRDPDFMGQGRFSGDGMAVIPLIFSLAFPLRPDHRDSI